MLQDGDIVFWCSSIDRTNTHYTDVGMVKHAGNVPMVVRFRPFIGKIAELFDTVSRN